MLIIIKQEEGDILNNEKLEITAAGLVTGARKINDGFTYFGSQIKLNDKIVMDYKLNLKSNNTNTIQCLYIFLIYFKNGNYYIRSCRDKGNSGASISLLMVKIDKGYVNKTYNVYYFNRHTYIIF